ncbi:MULTISPECIES: GNAT family N-acetyltransferase [unclassified Streptomyces]|uniref:GNAT family N-acetyltransferase n=1 Tax=unclassified Streptomyces TaxID=2593676 RepID=UPI002AA2A492|nr:GNAT family N-acetyltransferase [Streptomyces sp. Je 1-369]
MTALADLHLPTARLDCALRPVDPLTDAELVHAWVTHPRAEHWMPRNATLTDVERAYMAIAASSHREAYLGLREGVPSFLMEWYDLRELSAGQGTCGDA